MDTWLKKKKKRFPQRNWELNIILTKKAQVNNKKMAVHAALITIARTWMQPRIDVH